MQEKGRILFFKLDWLLKHWLTWKLLIFIILQMLNRADAPTWVIICVFFFHTQDTVITLPKVLYFTLFNFFILDNLFESLVDRTKKLKKINTISQYHFHFHRFIIPFFTHDLLTILLNLNFLVTLQIKTLFIKRKYWWRVEH